MGVYCRVRVEMSRSQSVIFRECVGDQGHWLVGYGCWPTSEAAPWLQKCRSQWLLLIHGIHGTCAQLYPAMRGLSNSGISTLLPGMTFWAQWRGKFMVDQTASEPSHVRHLIHSTTMNPHRAKSTNRRAGFNHCAGGIPKALTEVKPISFWSNRQLWSALTVFKQVLIKLILYMFFFLN